MNPAQPQTLQIAVFILYIESAFVLLDLLTGRYGSLVLLGLLLLGGQVAGGFGIANEFKWGYLLGIAMSFAPFALRFYIFGDPLRGARILNLIFEIALIALLLHPQSRDYQRIWFK